MGTIDVAALLEAEKAGSEGGELCTEEPASLLSCPPVVGTIAVAALLEAEEGGSEDCECGTEEPASLLSRPPAVGTIDVALTVTVVVLSPLLVKSAWPNNNKRKEYHRNTLHHFTARAMRTCSSSIPPNDVPVVMVELAADVAPAVTVVVLSPLVVEDDLPT